MNRPFRISTPADLGELFDRLATNGSLGELEPAPGIGDGARGALAMSPTWDWLTRDLEIATPSAGGYLVTASAPFTSIANTLRGFSAVVDAGVRVDVVPAGTPQTAVVATEPAASWVAEGAADTPSDPVFGAPVAFAPSTLRVSTVLSRRLMKQSKVAEAAARAELMGAVGRAIDAAVLGAGGSNMPTGIAGTTGRITQVGTALSFATIADVERQVLEAGARLDRLRYIARPAVRELLQVRERAAGSGMIVEADKIGSVPLSASNEGPADAMLVGDWSLAQVVFYGERPTVFANPFKYSSSGSVELTMHVEVAVGFPRPGAFAHFDAIT